MTRSRPTLVLVALFIATFVLATSGLLIANNQWYCWHWSSSAITTSNAASDAYWKNIIGTEFNQWADTCLTFSSGPQITGDAGFYGINGWLGLARLLDYDTGTCEILRAEALMNRSYLDSDNYGESADRHVTCQEIGHTVGLDHRRSPRDRTCMNDFWGWYPDYDQHDASMVAEITTGCSGGGGGSTCANGGENGRKRCSDGIDNDGDGCIDAADPDCQ